MTYLLWFHPGEKEYQTGSRESFKKVISNSNKPEQFVLLEKFVNLNESGHRKLNSQVNALNKQTKTLSKLHV